MIDAKSTLGEVAGVVATALERHRIRAVLTGGACASLHTDGAVTSYDLDFILRSAVSPGAIDQVMESIGFFRRGRRYEHPATKFFVEFPPGPLGIGRDIQVRPVRRRAGARSVMTLSATDSCRDRLAAFYHWRDRQSLEAAVQIARRRRVDLEKIRRWSVQEGAREGFQEFRKRLRASGTR